MAPFVGAVMVGAAALCFGGSLIGRRPLAVVAAAIMLASMVDLAVLGSGRSIVWTGLLAGGGLLLGFDLRRARVSRARTSRGCADAFPLEQPVMTLAALSYPATAWLVVAHEHGATVTPAAVAPRGHAHGEGVVPLVTSMAIAGLAVALAVLLVLSLSRLRGVLAMEAGGMSAMLAVMLLAPVIGA